MKKRFWITISVTFSLCFVALFGLIAYHNYNNNYVEHEQYAEAYKCEVVRLGYGRIENHANVYYNATQLTVIDDLFSTLEDALSNATQFFVNLFQGVVDLVWVAPSGTETTGHITVIGALLITAFAMGIFWVGFRLIRNLIKMRG